MAGRMVKIGISEIDGNKKEKSKRTRSHERLSHPEIPKGNNVVVVVNGIQ